MTLLYGILAILCKQCLANEQEQDIHFEFPYFIIVRLLPGQIAHAPGQ